MVELLWYSGCGQVWNITIGEIRVIRDCDKTPYTLKEENKELNEALRLIPCGGGFILSSLILQLKQLLYFPIISNVRRATCFGAMAALREGYFETFGKLILGTDHFGINNFLLKMHKNLEWKRLVRWTW